ncbi:MAG: sugar phosphate isomerase/epimerase [Planctomycetes bacterium]|nr:sugar phosphate isomerase/epimerase [Planctomycetota bacterium]
MPRTREAGDGSIKIGLNLFLWSGQATEALVPVLEKAKRWGFDGVEFPLFHSDEEVYRRLRAKLDALGLRCTGCTVAMPDKNPISDSAEVRRAGVQHLKDMLRMCKILGAEVLCGPLCAPVGLLKGRGRTQDEWRWAVESLREVGPYAEEAGVTAAVEYLNRFEMYFVNTSVDTRRLVAEVNHPRVRMMFDTFHANIEEKDTFAACKACGKHLAHVHISESDRGVPGTGQVDWDGAFRAIRALRYKGWLTIESFGQTVPEIAAAAAIWRPLFKSNEEVATRGLRFIKDMIGGNQAKKKQKTRTKGKR